MNKSDYASQEPARITVDIDGGDIAGWRWMNEHKPPLLFCHATGFCASVYKRMLQAVSADFDIFAIDLRGHGRSTLPADPRRLRSWNIYARDIAAFLDHSHKTDWTLAGHSMGGVTITMAAQGRADIRALKLIEPVAIPPSYALAAKTPFWGFFARNIPLVRQAARRRAAWPDRASAAASYTRKALFAHWADGVLADYLEDGLAETPEGVRLACEPAWEAATFAAHANDFWTAVAKAPAPITVLAADHPSTTTRADARERFKRRGASVTLISGVSHLAPMENPGLVADFIAGMS